MAYEGDPNSPGGTGGDYKPPEESASEAGLTPNGQSRWRYATDIMDYGPEVGSSKYAAVTYSDALADDGQMMFSVSSRALGAPGSDELWDVRLTSDDFEVCYIDEGPVSVEEFVTFVTCRPSTAGSIYYMRSGISTFKAYSADHIPPDYVPPGSEDPRDSMAQATSTGGSVAAGRSEDWQTFAWAGFSMNVTDVQALTGDSKLRIRYLSKSTTGATSWPSEIDWTFINVTSGQKITVVSDEKLLSAADAWANGQPFDQESQVQNPNGSMPTFDDVAVRIINRETGVTKTVPLGTFWSQAR